jgi:hypothetical protein
MPVVRSRAPQHNQANREEQIMEEGSSFLSANSSEHMGLRLKTLQMAMLATLVTLTACGGGGGSSQPPPPPSVKYNVGGSVSGLTAAGLVLASGSDTLNVSANATSFTMPTQLTTVVPVPPDISQFRPEGWIFTATA